MKHTWTHKKYGARQYTGTYKYARGEREFILTCTLKGGRRHNISFESWQMAKALGWRRG